MSTTTLIDKGFYSSQNIPWLGSGILDDQRAGGSVSWAMGEIPIILALVATFILWMRDDAKETRRIDRNEERKAAMVSNLMVVLCSDKDASPIVNTGTLNH